MPPVHSAAPTIHYTNLSKQSCANANIQLYIMSYVKLSTLLAPKLQYILLYTAKLKCKMLCEQKPEAESSLNFTLTDNNKCGMKAAQSTKVNVKLASSKLGPFFIHPWWCGVDNIPFVICILWSTILGAHPYNNNIEYTQSWYQGKIFLISFVEDYKIDKCIIKMINKSLEVARKYRFRCSQCTAQHLWQCTIQSSSIARRSLFY